MQKQVEEKLTKSQSKDQFDVQDGILRKIYTSSLRFLNPLKLEETYGLVVEEATKLVGADNGSIYLEVDGEFQLVYSSDPTHRSIKPRRRGNTYHAFTSMKPIIAEI